MTKNSKGGYCNYDKNSLSFIGLGERLQFETFEEFCNRADEILEIFKTLMKDSRFKMLEYKSYIYEHKFCDNFNYDLAAKDKCFEWLMSCEYEKVDKNDLYSILGRIRKEQK